MTKKMLVMFVPIKFAVNLLTPERSNASVPVQKDVVEYNSGKMIILWGNHSGGYCFYKKYPKAVQWREKNIV